MFESSSATLSLPHHPAISQQNATPYAEARRARGIVAVACRDPLCRELLGFLARHHRAGFNAAVLASLPGCRDLGLMQSKLQDLAAVGLVQAEAQNGAVIYRLTPCEPLHSLIRAAFAGESRQIA
jgi:hypothetical protein